jgi:NADPH:quinone reductase-like Zn-dependent oxidoreductase
MKIVRIHEFGGPEVLAVEEAPTPEPGPDEVLVRVRAASVNPIDYKVRSGSFAQVAPDHVRLGRDVAGIIEKIGADVKDFAPGDHVFAMLPGDRSGYAEYVTLPADVCAPRPTNLDDTQAAAVPLAATTAWQGLFDHGDLAPGQHVLIHGGAGGVGHFAVQLARAAGARVSTTVAKDDMETARELGAEQVVDYQSQRFEDEVRDVDLVFDLVGGDTQERSWKVLREGGRLISTLSEPSQREAKKHGARAANYRARPSGRELREIAQWIEEGKVRPIVASVMPLDEVAKAQTMLEKEHVRGKVVLEMTT